MSFQLPSSRYILPSFTERTSYGMKESNPYNKLFEERIIFLGVQVDDASANDVMAQLITLESTDPDRDITMYINTRPCGSFTALMAIYDTMMFVRPDIQTVCMGQAASAAAVCSRPDEGQAAGAALLPGADPPALRRGRRPGHRPGDPRAEIERVRTQMEQILARHTGGPRSRSARTSTATRSSRPSRPRSTGSSTRSSRAGS